MKNLFVLLLFFLIFNTALVQAEEDKDKKLEPKIKYVTLTGDKLTVFCTGLQYGFDKFTSYIGDKKLTSPTNIEKENNYSSRKITYNISDELESNNFINKKFYTEFVKVNGYYKSGSVASGQNLMNSIKTNKINIHKRPKNFKLTSNLKKTKLNYGYSYRLILKSKAKDADFSNYSVKTFINGEKKDNKIKGNRIIIKDIDVGNYNKLRISIMLDDKYISTIYKKLDNNFKVDFNNAKNKTKFVSLKFKGNFNDSTTKVFVNDKLFSSGNYFINGDELVLNLPKSKYKKEIRTEIYFKEKSRVSEKKYFNIKGLLTPKVSKVYIRDRDVIIKGKNLKGNENKIYINGKGYFITGKTYYDWKSNIENKGKYENMEELIGDEKDEKQEQLRKELSKSDKYFFESNLRKDRIKLDDTNFITGNTKFYLEIDGKKSKIRSLNLKKLNSSRINYNKKGDTYKPKVKVKFKNVSKGDRKINDLSSTEIGNLEFSSSGKNVVIKKLSFKLKSNYHSGGSLPVKSFKLGDKNGFLYKLDNNTYKLIFNNIIVKSSNDISKKLYITPSYQVNELKLDIIPFKYDYNSLKTDFKKINNYIKFYDSQRIFYKLEYSPCFDKDISYSNCKSLGYEKDSYWYMKKKDGNYVQTSSNKIKSKSKIKKEKRIRNKKIRSESNQLLSKIIYYINNNASNKVERKIYYRNFYKKLQKLKIKYNNNVIKKALNIMIDGLKKKYDNLRG